MDDRRGLRNGDCSEHGSTRAAGHCGGGGATIQPRLAHGLYERYFDGCHLAGCPRGTVLSKVIVQLSIPMYVARRTDTNLYGIVGATVVAGEQTRASLYHGCSSDGGGGGGGGDGTTDCV